MDIRRINGSGVSFMGTTGKGEKVRISFTDDNRPTADGLPHVGKEAKPGRITVYRRDKDVDIRTELFDDGGIATCDAFVAYLKENNLCYRGAASVEGSSLRIIRVRIKGYTRHNTPAFASFGFDADGKLEYFQAENGITAYPDSLLIAAYYRDYIRLTFYRGEESSVCVDVPTIRRQVLEGLRTDPDAIVYRLRRAGLPVIYDFEEDAVFVIFSTTQGWCEVLYERFLPQGAVIAGIRIHKADGSVEKHRVYGFAESLTERVDEGIRLPFLTEPIEKVSEKWRELLETFSVIAIG